jgi:hypothetical protein
VSWSSLSAVALLLAVLAVSTGTHDSLLVGAVVAAAAAAALLVAAASASAPATAARAPSPRRAIDVSVLLPQSDPDAPGASRPRAPGVRLAAA